MRRGREGGVLRVGSFKQHFGSKGTNNKNRLFKVDEQEHYTKNLTFDLL